MVSPLVLLAIGGKPQKKLAAKKLQMKRKTIKKNHA